MLLACSQEVHKVQIYDEAAHKYDIDELHLTRVDSFASLRPQFHHVDAQTDNERSNSRAQRESEHPPVESEARAVNMAVKSIDDEEQLDMSHVGKVLRGIQEEAWTKFDWVDEEVRSTLLYSTKATEAVANLLIGCQSLPIL